MNIKVIFNEFKSQVTFTLFLIWILAVWHLRTINSFVYPLLAVLTVAVADLFVTWIRDRKLYFPSASLVTGFLIGLIIAPSEPFWMIILAAILASLSKQFINVGLRQHIFNPAAFGIMATSLALNVPVAWWAVAWSRWPLIILVPLMIRILWRMKRLILPVTFLTTYFIYLFFQFSPNDAVVTLVDGTFLLFALVMLPEPITSKTQGSLKYLFGVMVAFLAILISRTNFLTDAFLSALLISNLIGFLLLRFRKTFSQSKRPN
ncbi:RnfABCDGE type electron transport complex subunit D [Candidatus Curtissbacteria bacterium]|nr:RnfABCDGE type electron transport complex subunit D [Candidatus Curtissbacteria bacterium]